MEYIVGVESVHLRRLMMNHADVLRIHYTPGEKRAIISMFKGGMKQGVLLKEYGVLPKTLNDWAREFREEEKSKKRSAGLKVLGWFNWKKGTALDFFLRFLKVGSRSRVSTLRPSSVD